MNIYKLNCEDKKINQDIFNMLCLYDIEFIYKIEKDFYVFYMNTESKEKLLSLLEKPILLQIKEV